MCVAYVCLYGCMWVFIEMMIENFLHIPHTYTAKAQGAEFYERVRNQ